jgi:hypothetical protein
MYAKTDFEMEVSDYTEVVLLVCKGCMVNATNIYMEVFIRS